MRALMSVSATESKSEGRSLEMFLKVVEGRFGEFDILLEWEGGVQDDTQAADY